MSKRSLRVTYDDIGDVLYIWKGKHLLVTDEEDEEGLYLRYDSGTNMPAGAIVVDYKECWTPNHSQLVDKLANFLGLSKSQTDKAIQSAI
jgi:hypothetical protein